MTFITYLRDAWGNLISNKLRSFLSILGIVIGLFAVIFLMSFGAGAQQGVKDKMASLITNNITITSNGGYTQWTDDTVHGYVKAITLTTDLVDEIQYYFPELSGKVTYSNSMMGTIENSSDDTLMGQFAGVPMNYIDAMAYEWGYGSQFSNSNFSNIEDVAIVNKNVVDNLFSNTYPIGQYVYFNSKKFRIIGVLNEESTFGQVLIPITTYQQKIDMKTKISSITVVLGYDDDVDEWQNKLKYFLSRKYNVKHIDLAGFSISSMSSLGDAIDSAMSIFTYLLAAIGSISLLVGGIGVMNIMLVSVTERTREIGIRKAIGALNRDIITQFLIESIFVTAIGGAIAILLSWLMIKFVNNLDIEGVSFVMTGNVAVLATTLTFIIGIVSGIGPAKKAAELQPIDALRFE